MTTGNTKAATDMTWSDVLELNDGMGKAEASQLLARRKARQALLIEEGTRTDDSSELLVTATESGAWKA